MNNWQFWLLAPTLSHRLSLAVNVESNFEMALRFREVIPLVEIREVGCSVLRKTYYPVDILGVV